MGEDARSDSGQAPNEDKFPKRFKFRKVVREASSVFFCFVAKRVFRYSTVQLGCVEGDDERGGLISNVVLPCLRH